MPTKRSGFTNVRVCLDCKQTIGEGDLCGCPATHPFVPGAAITLCFDEAGERPLALAQVARLGNGAFRIEGAEQWYDLDGRPGKGSTRFARIRREGDEELLTRRAEARKMLSDVERWESQIAGCKVAITRLRQEKREALNEAIRRENAVKKIDVAALGEAARVQAETEAKLKIENLLKEVATWRETAAKREAETVAADAQIVSCNAKLDALPDDIQTIRILGDGEALRLYLQAV